MKNDIPNFAIILTIAIIISVISTPYVLDIIHETHGREIELIPESPTPLHLEENMTFIGSYETSIHFYGESGMYNRIFVVHDNKRNVTCYLYKDGISCIPDYYIGDKNV